MISMKHEGLVQLFRNRPLLAPELLKVLEVKLPSFTEARVESAEFNQVVPTEYRADMVVLLLDGKPVFAIVVEVQLSRADSKRWSWPEYLTALRKRMSCPVALLVVAPDPAIARWSATPIETGHPGFVLRPLVMGPGAVPAITDEEVARRDPELAVLSAMAHGQADVGQLVALAALMAVKNLDPERARLYWDLVLSSLSGAARQALEKLMEKGKYEYQSDFARKYVAQGREEGREEGRQEGEAGALLEVLDARGLEVDAQARQRILSCTDLATLKSWLRKAVRVQTVEELFGSDAREPVPSSG
jgi:hypothetical protein